VGDNREETASLEWRQRSLPISCVTQHASVIFELCAGVIEAAPMLHSQIEAVANRRSSDVAMKHLNPTAEPCSEIIGADQHLSELAIVIPTFNEGENIRPLLARLEAALNGIRWETIIVDDDSTDGTADLVRQVARQNPRVRVIHRIGRRGLTSACVEGVLSSSTSYFAVIDADMQHDERLLPRMFERLVKDDLDIVVGSRYVEGGSVGGWSIKRRLVSRVAGHAARLVMKASLQDPMSGFFVMRRKAFDEAVRQLSQQGFKILLDLFASAPRPLRFAEVPYQFVLRQHGESKLDSMAAWEYGMLLADKLFGHIIPTRFLLFGAVGSFGVIVHMLALALAFHSGIPLAISQAIAVVTAMTFNFALNNSVTYRDRRLTGWRFLRGLLSFYAICSLGAVGNVGIASVVYAEQPIWWVAGLAGALVGVVWNYAVSGFFTWRR
jgi:dolichol-phosphate mannosyltransferase